MKQSTKQILGFNDFWFIIGGMLVSGLTLPILLTGNGTELFSEDYFVTGLVGMGFCFVYWMVGRQTVIYLRRKLPGLTNIFKRIFLQSAAMLLFIFGVNQACKPFLTPYISQIISQEAKDSHLTSFLVSTLLAAAILMIYETIYMLQQWRAAAIESERFRKESVLAQLNALKSQVNPHFLFNSLNTLTSIVHEDPDLSVEFIKKLSTTYRYLLEIRNQELITLEEELECVKAYGFLLKTRFGESLEIDIDVAQSHLSSHIIPLSLQMVVENAIKHNVVSRRRPLQITITTLEAPALLIHNNKQLKLHPEASTGTGLQNIRSRYALVTDQEVAVKDTDDAFEVILPLVQVNAYERTHS